MLYLVSTVTTAEVSRSGQALIFPNDQEPPEETLNFRWSNEPADGQAGTGSNQGIPRVINLLQCSIGANTYFKKKLSLLETLSSLEWGQRQPTGYGQLVKICVRSGCGHRCSHKAKFDWIPCLEECTAMSVTDVEQTRKRSGYDISSPVSARNNRNKRYRLGLYDCISSYCNKLEGSERKSCIVYYCHRSVGSAGEEEE